jgi:DNA-binding MarR family transcriptional regulator
VTIFGVIQRVKIGIGGTVIHKRRRKTAPFSLLLLIVMISLFLFSYSCVLVAYADDPDYVNAVSEDIIKFSDMDVISTDPLTGSPAIALEDDITIILPNGSTITDISDTSMNVQISNKSKLVYFSDAIDSFSNISFHKSIDGLDDFNVYIIFAEYAAVSDIDWSIVNYTIDWGNGDVSTGKNAPSSTLSYAYRKEGNYPITIKLADSDGITYAYLKNQTFKLSTGQYIQLWVGENKETVAASSAGISGVALLGFALTETGKYKLLALFPLLIPLYTRIQKEDVLDQFVRGEVYGFIKTKPGVHYNQIIRELNVKNGTLSYHLHMLEKTGMIKSRKEGLRYRAFYPTGVKFPKEERYRLTELQMNIIKTVKENEGISQKEIASMLNEKHQTINYNIKVLQQAGFIQLRKQGRKTSCFIFEDICDQAV